MARGQEAASYAEQGLKVFPLFWINDDGICSCGNAGCGSPGKHPIGRLVPNGLHAASNNPATVKDWWSVVPNANIGLVTGETTGLVVVDLDHKKGGIEALDHLQKQHAVLPKTKLVRTGGGGYHLYFRYPPSVTISNSVEHLGPGIDVRGDGGYVVAPPSNHLSGEYELLRDATVEDMPEWLISMTRKRKPGIAKLGTSLAYQTKATISSGKRNDTLTSYAGYMRRAAMDEASIYAALSVMNGEKCVPPLPDDEVSRIAHSVARYAPAIELIPDMQDGDHEYFTSATVIDEIIRRIEAGEMIGIETGFEDLDNITGGFSAGDFVVVAGRPSMGKTALGINIARNVAKGSAVAVFSVEMSRYAIGMRMLSAETGINTVHIRNALRKGTLSAGELASLKDAGAHLRDDNLLWVDEPALKVERLYGHMLNMVQDHEVGLVVVDYLQLMRGTGDTREQAVAGLSIGLKTIAKDFEVPVLAMAQLNRSLENRMNKRPILSDLRDSGQIEQDADIVMFIHRPEKYGEESIRMGANMVDSTNVAELIIAKQRNGPTGVVHLHFDPEKIQFETYQRGLEHIILPAARGAKF